MQWQGLCFGILCTATRLVTPLGSAMSPLPWEQCICFLGEKEAQLDPNLTGKLLTLWSIYVFKFSHGTGFWFCLFLCFSRTTHSRISRKECCITFFLFFSFLFVTKPGTLVFFVLGKAAQFFTLSSGTRSLAQKERAKWSSGMNTHISVN